MAVKPGASLDSDELLAYCKANLVKYKWPKPIAVVGVLPRTGVVKIDKPTLKAGALATSS